jgi:8-oxo-dGTP pyrophosphatase MutT (NUDIX family)
LITVDLRTTAVSGDFGVVRASMVCYSVAPTTNTCYMLLGLERGDQWCDFGGHLESGETSCQTAAREFAEESLCVVAVDSVLEVRDERDSPRDYIQSLTRLLADARHFLRLDLRKEGETDVRVFYLKEIAWQPTLPERFERMTQRLTQPPAWTEHPALQSADPIEVKPQWTEKSEVAWWSFDRLRQVLRNDGCYKGMRFRRSFLPTLAMVLDHLEAIQH